MKETLEVRNIGAIRNTGVLEISPLTVFIGSSASGKSTLMKILILMRYIYKRYNIRNYIKNSHVDDTIFYIRFNDYLRDDIKQVVNKTTSYIRYSVCVNGNDYVLTYENGKLSMSSTIPDEDLCYTKEVWVSENRGAIATLSSQGSLAKNASLGFFFDETFSDFDAATDLVKHYDLNYVGLNMDVVRGGNNQKKFILKPQDDSYEPFELRHASSGIQSTAPLMVLVRYFSHEFSFKNSQQRNIIDELFKRDLTTKYKPEMELADVPKVVHIHVEEPELSLDPRSQRKFIDELVALAFMKKASDRSLELVFATHSPFILNHLNVLLRRNQAQPHVKPENLSVYTICDGTAQSLKAQDLDTGEFVIDSMDLSEPLADIFNEYRGLENARTTR